MAKLTEDDRKEIIQNLIANEGSDEAGPWSEDDQEMLANMEDAKLIQLDEHRQAVNGCSAAAAAAREGFRDAEGGSHVFNEETGQWESRFKPKKTTPTVVTPQIKPMTSEEWFEAAPDEVKEIFNQSRSEQEDKKKVLIGRLLANAKGMDKERLQKITERFWKMSINELQDQVDLMPKIEHQKTTPFVGASPAPVVVPGGGLSANEDDFNEDEFLPLPTINWAEAAKR